MRHNYKKLEIWKRAIALALDIYKLIKDFPEEEKYGLTSQMRKSSISVSSNIAEGSVFDTQKQFSHYLSMSTGSLCELETQLIISRELGFASNFKIEKTLNEVIEIMKMITKFKQNINKRG